MAHPAYHESLPYIDPEPSPAELAAAHALIQAEAEAQQSALPPPAPPAPSPHSFSPLIETELARIAASQAPSRLDLSRYENPSLSSVEPQDQDLPGTLRAAAVSAEYLSSRAQHLSLLDTHGRNAWLLGNYHLERELARLEGELARERGEIDRVNAARRRAQEEVSGEMDALEGDWRRALGRVVETEVALGEVRGRIREELRKGTR